MGYNTTAITQTLTAKLTPFGRQQLVSTNNLLITSFSFGDSDANYYATLPLTTGQVPAEAGEVGPSASISNSTTQNVSLKSVLIASGNGVTKKPVESQSIQIVSSILSNGQVTISGSNLSQNVVNRNDTTTDSLVNLYYSFGLPLTSLDDANLTGVTYANGGFSDTALSGLAQSNILVLGINNATYGECIDGKQIRLNLTTSAGTYSIYSSFQQKDNSTIVEDANIRDTSPITAGIDSNISFLFSDTIMTPNGGDASLSWGTGFGSLKPFSQGSKQLYNFQTNSNLALTADTIVGIAYLDKGFLVITHPTILADYDSITTTSSTITFDSVSTNVAQNITCIGSRGEFGSSTNPTFTRTDVPRISEVGLFDSIGNLIAVAKTDRHIVKNVNDFLALGINITL